MNKLKKFIKNEYVFSILSKIIVVSIGVFYSAIFARYCGPTIKGEIAVINSVISIGAIVITFGMHQAYPFYRKKYGDESYKDIFLSIMVTIFAIYIVLAFFIVTILQESLSVELMTAIMLMPILGFANVVSYVAMIEMPNRRNTVFMIIHFVELLYVIFLYFVSNVSFFSAVSAFVIAEVLKAALFTIQLKPRVSKFSLEQILELYKYGFFPMVALLMTTLNYKIDIFMLRGFKNVSDAEIGIYSVGITLAEKVLLFPDSMKQILMSKLAKGKTYDEVAKVSRLCFVISIGCAICILLLGKFIIEILYGNEYLDAYAVTIISVFGTAPMVFFKMIGQYNIINKKQIYNVVMLFVSIVVNIGINILLVPIMGIEGAAIATMSGHIVCAIVFVIYFSKISNIKVTEIIFVQKKDFDFFVTQFKRSE